MPHLVSNFLRSSSGSIPGIKSSAVSRSRNSSRAASGRTSRNPSPNGASASTSTSTSASHAGPGHEDHAVKVPELIEALKKHHRLSLHFPRLSKDHQQQSHNLHHALAPAAINWTMESPPIVFHGTPQESTGALVSGQLTLDIKEDARDVETFSASVVLTVTHKRPFHSNCSDCRIKTTILEKRDFLSHPTSLGNGKHNFPFSVLLAGNLPASMDTPVVSISYVLKAEAVLAASGAGAQTSITLERSLDARRSLPEPLYPHNSVRVFPPTNIKAAASYVSTIDPLANNKMTLKLDGLMTHNEKFGTVDLWRLKRLTWKLEETVKTVAPACEKHNPGPAERATKGLPRSESRVIGEKSLHEGWKSDYAGADGTVDMELDFSVNHQPVVAQYACDTRTDDGTVVSHSLCLELVVSKEYAQEGKTHICHQTGTGRILRMHFAVVLTHNAGMGISWDNEAPPVYEDVPPSPPEYQFDDDPIEYHDLEELDAARAATAPNSRRQSRVGL